MPVSATTQATLDSMTNNVIKYPDPFFDLSKNYIPTNIKTLFKFCKNIFYTNAQMRNVINKKTQYPITEILYSPDIDKALANKYDSILHDELKIKKFLIGAGMDYFTYGNSIITTFVIPKRFLKCNRCGAETPMNRTKYKFKSYKFEGICTSDKCKNSTTSFSVIDSKVKTMRNFKLLRLNPDNIDIEYNPLTGDSEYLYKIPTKIKKEIRKGTPRFLETVPLVFIKAIREKKKVSLDSSSVYHLKYPSLAEEDMGWAKPPILPALKDVYYLQTLRRGNEAIVNEHIVPKKAIFPSSTIGIDPFVKMNMNTWTGKIEEQLRKWKIDPNHIATFPIPIGYQELGGNAKMLMLTPEMKFVEESIITSMEVPLEFIKGGASWTGSSISLRNVENGFINYREHLRDLLNYFIIPRIAGYLNIEKVKVHFKKFKMSDDAQSKQLAIQLYQSGVISNRTLLDEFGIDYKEEELAINSSKKANLVSILNQQKINTIAAGEAQIISAKYQGKAQAELDAQAIKSKINLFSEELNKELQNPQEDLFDIIEKLTIGIKNMPPQLQQQNIINMSTNIPVTLSLIMERLNYYNKMDMQNAAYSNGMQNAAYPDNSRVPGTREGDKIQISDKEKTKGQTRGEP